MSIVSTIPGLKPNCVPKGINVFHFLACFHFIVIIPLLVCFLLLRSFAVGLNFKLLARSGCYGLRTSSQATQPSNDSSFYFKDESFEGRVAWRKNAWRQNARHNAKMFLSLALLKVHSHLDDFLGAETRQDLSLEKMRTPWRNLRTHFHADAVPPTKDYAVFVTKLELSSENLTTIINFFKLVV